MGTVVLRYALHHARSVKMAMIAPLSGPWARQGQLLRMGAEMAIDDINASGGIQKLGGAKFELIVADAGDSTEKAKNAAQRLLADQPDLIGGFGSWLSSFTLSVTEVTERAQLPWLTLSYSDAITNRGFRFIFQTSPTADHQAAETIPRALDLAQTATGKRPKTVGLIMDNTAPPVSFAKPLRDGGFEKAGLKLMVDQIYTPPLSDATPLVEKVRSAKPDFLLLLTSAMPDCNQVLEKLDEFKLSGESGANHAPGQFYDTDEGMGASAAREMRADKRQGGTDGSQTRRWREPDSNFWSQLQWREPIRAAANDICRTIVRQPAIRR
jgi:branched-chain amino acid transport system substrate-binding protein